MSALLLRVVEHQYNYRTLAFKVEEFLPLRYPQVRWLSLPMKSTLFSCFGVDPLDNAALQALREQQFNNVTDLQNEFEDIGNANCHSFENAILTYASITMQLLT